MNMFRAFMELDSLYEEVDLNKRWYFTGKAKFNHKITNKVCILNITEPIEVNGVSDKKALSNVKFVIRDKNKDKCNINTPIVLFDYFLDIIPKQKERYANICPKCEKVPLNSGGTCPVCDEGEEDYLEEGVFDSKPVGRSSWVSVSGKPIGLSNSASVNTPTTSPPQQNTNNKYFVRIVSHGGRLRALATDGVHPAAFVAFPNNLRQFEGQQYEVDQLIWNGKNYRVAGNIVEI